MTLEDARRAALAEVRRQIGEVLDYIANLSDEVSLCTRLSLKGLAASLSGLIDVIEDDGAEPPAAGEPKGWEVVLEAIPDRWISDVSRVFNEFLGGSNPLWNIDFDLPYVVLRNASRPDVDRLAEALRAAGATVSVREE